MNQKAAEYQNQKLQDDAMQSELFAIMQADGAQFAHHMARKTGFETATVRWHLREMQKRGEIRFRAGWGYMV